jgi:hypothetical protein
MKVKVIVISGSMGSGKTTVLAEASDVLAAGGVVHAAIDVDALGVAHLPEEAWIDLAHRNLASVWANYAAAGVTRLLAEAIESRAGLDQIRKAIPDCEIVVCRLRAQLGTMQRRVSLREPGMLREKLVARVASWKRRSITRGWKTFRSRTTTARSRTWRGNCSCRRVGRGRSRIQRRDRLSGVIREYVLAA